MIKKINHLLLADLVENAKFSKRKRTNHNFHLSYDDPINRMLNVIEPDSYVQPHKHENPDKREIFILLKGKLAVVFFNETGDITEHIILDNKKNFGVEIPPGIWHTIIALESGTVVYEVKDGPYSVANDKNFAPWAPGERDENCWNYLNILLSDLSL